MAFPWPQLSRRHGDKALVVVDSGNLLVGTAGRLRVGFVDEPVFASLEILSKIRVLDFRHRRGS